MREVSFPDPDRWAIFRIRHNDTDPEHLKDRSTVRIVAGAGAEIFTL